jgi:outer membrane protein assembly factor BamB
MVFPGDQESQQMALNATTGKIIWDTLTKGPMIFQGSYYQGMFVRGGTDDNTMYCFNATNGNIIWTYTPNTNGYFCTGTAVAYGIVYELNKDGNLYAVNINTGQLLWEYKGPGPLMFPGNAVVADGMVYATTGQNVGYNGEVGASQFACLNAYTGQVIWTLPIEALAPRESTAIAYGNLYIIPGDVTTAVDTISGNEYTTSNQLWAIGSASIPVSNWYTFRADPTHSSTAQEGPSNLTLAWEFTTNGAVISSPTVVNGIVCVGSEDKNVYALGAWSGNLIWSFATNGTIEDSPAVASGYVYIESDDGYVYCLNAYNGALSWQTFVNSDLPFTYGSIVLTSSPVVVGNIVYIGSLDGNLYALDANNGNIVWKTSTVGPIECTPAVDNGAVYFTSQGTTTGMLYKLDANTGSVIWTLPIPYEQIFTGGTELLASPSIAGGMVFACSNARTYYAVNEATGDVVWNFTDPSASEFLYCSPIYVNGQLYIIDKFNIACLNATNGYQLWTFYTGDELYIPPSYADGKIYDVTSQRDIFILDAATNGTKLVTMTTPSSSWSSPTIANDMLYIGCNDWNVYCYANDITNQTSSPTPASSPATSSPATSFPTPASSPTPSSNLTLTPSLELIASIVAILIIALLTVSFVIAKRSKKRVP